MTISKAAAFIPMLLATVAPWASAFTVNPGQELVIDFHLPTSASPALLLHPTDTAYLAIDAAAFGTAQMGKASLYSGSVLLGENTASRTVGGPASFYFYWTATGSDFTLPGATQIDGTTFRDRSIAGQIRTSFDGTLTFADIYFDAGNGWYKAIGIEGGTQAVVDSVRISQVSSVPEPASAMLLLGGLLAVGVGKARLRRNGRPSA